MRHPRPRSSPTHWRWHWRAWLRCWECKGESHSDRAASQHRSFNSRDAIGHAASCSPAPLNLSCAFAGCVGVPRTPIGRWGPRRTDGHTPAAAACHRPPAASLPLLPPLPALCGIATLVAHLPSMPFTPGRWSAAWAAARWPGANCDGHDPPLSRAMPHMLRWTHAALPCRSTPLLSSSVGGVAPGQPT